MLQASTNNWATSSYNVKPEKFGTANRQFNIHVGRLSTLAFTFVFPLDRVSKRTPHPLNQNDGFPKHLHACWRRTLAKRRTLVCKSNQIIENKDYLTSNPQLRAYMIQKRK